METGDLHHSQIVFSSLAVVPGTKSFSEEVRTRKNKNKALFVTNSITKGIRFKEFNSFISNRNARMVNFSVVTSKEILHYLDINLANSSTDTVVILCVNDLLNDYTHPNIDSLIKNLNSTVQKCDNFVIGNVFISRLVYTTSTA